ncbi:hypothetical protein F4678DRAFT_152549 [Xylaria arbuscula]|nr:hypothetical protein F4678DRAFT_152549 [Xylaria arbuscula]
MERERYADRYSVVGSLRAIAPEMEYPEGLSSGSERSCSHRTKSGHTGSRRDADLSEEKRIDYSSSGRSHVARSSHDSHSRSNYYSGNVRSTKAPNGREYDGYNTGEPSTYSLRLGSDRSRVDHYQDDMTRHEWETRGFVPTQSPAYFACGLAYQQERLESNSPSVVSHTDSTYTRVLTRHSQGTWYAEEENGQYGDSGRGHEHETVTNEKDSQGEVRRAQRVQDYLDIGRQEEWPFNEESQYGGETKYDSDDSEQSITSDSENEEDPDQYVSDGGVDEEDELDDGFDDDYDYDEDDY